jgi:16S rRNA (guanine1207-N2)-methyltransferase
MSGASGRWLAALVDDTPAAEVWHRTAHGGRPASAWPPRGPYDGIALRLPRTSAELTMTLHALGARLASGGRLVLAGLNDEGIRPAGRRLSEVFADVEDHGGRGHGRVYTARSPRSGLRGELDDWAETHDGLTSWPGLFAHGRVDAATALLLAHLPELGEQVLDLGCGIGIVARALVARGHRVDASDVDALAVEATRRNAPSATVHLADGIPAGTWDAIVTNPPLHRGADRDPSWITRLLATAPDHLRPGGGLVLVTRASIPVPALAVRQRSARLATDGRATVWRITTRTA